MKRDNKFGARKTVVGDLNFDSKREAKRWGELRVLERAGKITALERQITFVLAPSVKIEGEKKARPALRFKADFRYFSLAHGVFVIEDSKGFADTAFRIRQHLMKSVHGIDVRLS